MRLGDGPTRTYSMHPAQSSTSSLEASADARAYRCWCTHEQVLGCSSSFHSDVKGWNGTIHDIESPDSAHSLTLIKGGQKSGDDVEAYDWQDAVKV